MQFAHPNILALLLVFPPALVAFFWWSLRKRKDLMAQFIQARLLPGLISGVSISRERARLTCLVLAVACIIVALARPQWGFTWEEVKVRGVDIVVAIDTSKSMLAEDIAPNRLARAKLAALDLMQLAKSDRLGLVAFAGTAFLQCPLTIDDSAFRQSVEALNVNLLPQGGTAVAEAIETAQTAFKEGDNHRVLVLMTDGEDHDSGALEAAQKAAQKGLRIYTIGIGTPEGELLRIKDAQGRPDYIRDEQGNVVKSHLNERLLQEIASTGQGGFYLPLRGAKTMDTLYDQGLAKLPKSEHQQKLVKQYEERYQWPLGLGIVLLIVEILLPERKREARSGRARVLASRSSIHATAAVLVFMLWFFTPGALASPASALREYKAGKYDQALKEYEQLLQRKGDDPRLHFNAGAAAYRNHQFDEAAKQFNEAVASPDLKLQELSYYNRGNAQYWLGENNSDPKKRTEAWEKSLKDYELSMKLNPQDSDAKYNHEFVKKRLEELKQQEQQENKKDQQQDQDKNDQSKQDQNQQQQQQQQQQQSKEDQSDQKQNTSQNKQDKQDQQSKQEQQSDQEKQKQQADKKPEPEKQDQQKSAQAASQPKDGSGETNQEEFAAGQMTPEQARQLLDSQKGDEKMLQLKPDEKPGDSTKPIRDW